MIHLFLMNILILILILCFLFIFLTSHDMFGHLFGWHPFTPEDPLVSKRCNALFDQICSN